VYDAIRAAVKCVVGGEITVVFDGEKKRRTLVEDRQLTVTNTFNLKYTITTLNTADTQSALPLLETGAFKDALYHECSISSDPSNCLSLANSYTSITNTVTPLSTSSITDKASSGISDNVLIGVVMVAAFIVLACVLSALYIYRTRSLAEKEKDQMFENYLSSESIDHAGVAGTAGYHPDPVKKENLRTSKVSNCTSDNSAYFEDATDEVDADDDEVRSTVSSRSSRDFWTQPRSPHGASGKRVENFSENSHFGYESETGSTVSRSSLNNSSPIMRENNVRLPSIHSVDDHDDK